MATIRKKPRKRLAPLVRRHDPVTAAFTTLSGDAENRSAGIVAKTIVPSRFHAPRTARSVRSQCRSDPPSMSMRLSLSSAKNPIDRPSGDQNGDEPRSVPGSGRAGDESSDRSHNWDGLRTGREDHLQSIRRNRERWIPVGGVLISSRTRGRRCWTESPHASPQQSAPRARGPTPTPAASRSGRRLRRTSIRCAPLWTRRFRCARRRCRAAGASDPSRDTGATAVEFPPASPPATRSSRARVRESPQ